MLAYLYPLKMFAPNTLIPKSDMGMNYNDQKRQFEMLTDLNLNHYKTLSR